MAYLITVDGIVQGVGFRPFVFNLAKSLGIKGYVKNSTFGVVIHLECDEDILYKFLEALKVNPPRNSKILDLSIEKVEDLKYDDFFIDKSLHYEGVTLIPADIAICDDCLRELFDPSNRRYLYPFINCTNCGPRYSIIKNIPYDRDKTTMSCFKMCNECESEYNDVKDRRFHAQPNCCGKCGPEVYLADFKGVDAIRYCAELIDRGEIVAVKGLGGYHLICDALNRDAIERLRSLKNRRFKPFAVMVKSSKTIEKYLTDEIKVFFDSPEAPIIILDTDGSLPENISPLNRKIGFMKAYTPLHQLLFKYLKTDFIIATSANLKDEPIVIDEKMAEEKLDRFTGYFLHHNRPIHNRVDDSVFTIFDGKPYPIRVSRGFAPIPLTTKVFYKDSFFGAGAGLKSHFAMTKGKYIIVSQYLGDLDNVETADFYEETFYKIKNLFEMDIKKIITDLHPDYFSTIFAEKYGETNGITTVKLQHHKAHLYSLMAENNITDNVIGVIFDGTGLGEDKAIWGGEVFYVKGEMKRRFHLKYVRQPGGDASAKAPYKMLLGYLIQFSFNSSIVERIEEIFGVKNEAFVLKKLIDKSINSPLTSSMGRLFESVGSLITNTKINEFEGHAAIALESIARYAKVDPYSYRIDNDVIDFSLLFEELIDDYFDGIPLETISFKFHFTIAHIILDCCKIIREETNIDTVLFSGGVFQNTLLLRLSFDLLHNNRFKPICHRKVPPNDASIALGQVYYAGLMG